MITSLNPTTNFIKLIAILLRVSKVFVVIIGESGNKREKLYNKIANLRKDYIHDK